MSLISRIKPTLTSVSIEITSDCNMDCPYCFRKDRKVGNMDFELFKQVIDQLPYYTRIGLSFGGESIVHPQFKEMAEYAIKHKFRSIRLVTNGTLEYPNLPEIEIQNSIDLGQKPPKNLMTRFPFKYEHPIKRHKRCAELYRHLAILWNGDVTLCCNDIGGQLVFDNIKNKSIKEVWSGEHMRKLRKKGYCEGCCVY
jgi:MoaA/NifB/PqqE/SkfB family radical SAM enzyme